MCKVEGTALCDAPLRRNTGTHTLVVKQTSNYTVRFGAASAKVPLDTRIGDQKESVCVNTDGDFFVDGVKKGTYVSVRNLDAATLMVDTNVAGPLG